MAIKADREQFDVIVISHSISAHHTKMCKEVLQHNVVMIRDQEDLNSEFLHGHVVRIHSLSHVLPHL